MCDSHLKLEFRGEKNKESHECCFYVVLFIEPQQQAEMVI